jgi:hypothetical protein
MNACRRFPRPAGLPRLLAAAAAGVAAIAAAAPRPAAAQAPATTAPAVPAPPPATPPASGPSTPAADASPATAAETTAMLLPARPGSYAYWTVSKNGVAGGVASLTPDQKTATLTLPPDAAEIHILNEADGTLAVFPVRAGKQNALRFQPGDFTRVRRLVATVAARNGRPVKSAVVTLTDASGKRAQRVLTPDSAGRAEFGKRSHRPRDHRCGLWRRRGEQRENRAGGHRGARRRRQAHRGAPDARRGCSDPQRSSRRDAGGDGGPGDGGPGAGARASGRRGFPATAAGGAGLGCPA